MSVARPCNREAIQRSLKSCKNNLYLLSAENAIKKKLFAFEWFCVVDNVFCSNNVKKLILPTRKSSGYKVQLVSKVYLFTSCIIRKHFEASLL